MVQFHDRIWGPDVSSWQGDVDWKTVHNDGASFGITKATEGISYVNPYAAAEWEEMGNEFKCRVQYHYARPVKNAATDEAAFFLANVLPLKEGDIIALDLETDSRDGPFTNGAYWANRWMESVEARVGFPPMLYCNGGIIRDPSQRFMDLPDIGQHNGLWLASWQEVFPAAVKPWDTVALWQFTNSGNVPGIGGFVDLNIFNGTLETMLRYGKPAEVSGGNPPSSGGGTDELYSQLSQMGNRLHDLSGELADLMNQAWQLAQQFGGKK